MVTQWWIRKLTRLLAGIPKRVNELLGVDATANRDKILRAVDGNTVQLLEIDFNAVIHLAQCGGCAMGTIVCEIRNVACVGVFNLNVASLLANCPF